MPITRVNSLMAALSSSARIYHKSANKRPHDDNSQLDLNFIRPTRCNSVLKISYSCVNEEIELHYSGQHKAVNEIFIVTVILTNSS